MVNRTAGDRRADRADHHRRHLGVSGLARTGSHDVVIERVFVPGQYTCEFGPGATPQASTSRARFTAIPSMLRPRCRLAPLPWGSPKGRWTRAWNWRRRSVLPGPRRPFGNFRCFRSGWRKRWGSCDLPALGCTPQCSRPGRRCWPEALRSNSRRSRVPLLKLLVPSCLPSRIPLLQRA